MLQVTPSEARFLQSAIPNRRAKDTIFISMFGKKAEERSENLPISGVGWLCAYPRGNESNCRRGSAGAVRREGRSDGDGCHVTEKKGVLEMVLFASASECNGYREKMTAAKRPSRFTELIESFCAEYFDAALSLNQRIEFFSWQASYLQGNSKGTMLWKER